MAKERRLMKWESCPVCGGDVEIETYSNSEAEVFYDEDPVYCIYDCKREVGHFSVDDERGYVRPNEWAELQ